MVGRVYPQNLAWIDAASFRTDDGQTDDKRLHHDRNSPDKLKQS